MISRQGPDLSTTVLGEAIARTVDAGAWRGAARANASSRGSDGGWIDFSLPLGAGIVVIVDIRGIKAWAIIDTGASVSVIDEDLAKELGLAFVGSAAFQSDVGAATGRFVERPAIRLGQAPLMLSRLIAAPLSSLKQTVGRPVALIIGQDAFATSLLDIDLPNCRLSLRERGGAPFPAEFHRTALLSGSNGRRCVQVSVEGVSLSAVFDLGSSNPVMLSKTFASQRGLLNGKRLSSAATSTLGGVALSTTCRLRDVTIAGFKVAQAPAEAFDAWTCEDVPANIGLPIFQDFRMLIDLAGDSLWLARQDGSCTPFKIDRSGLGLAVEADGLRVMHVARGGPAEAAGWQTSTRIIAVDGRPIGLDYVESGLCEWRYGEPGRLVQLTGADGRRHELILADYI